MRLPSPREVPTTSRGTRRLVAALAVLAVLLPAGGLLWAGLRARDAVIERVLVGQAATAQAVTLQFGLAWEQGLEQARAAAGRPSMQDGLVRGDAGLLSRSLSNISAAGTFTGVAAYDLSGRLVASAGSPPTMELVDPPGAEVVSAARVTGGDATVEVLEPVVMSGDRVGTVRVQLSLRALLPDLGRLRYGRTGTTTVVDSDGRFLLTADDVLRGRRLATAPALALAAAHRRGTLRVYSPQFHTRVISNYAPVDGTTFGVFTRQSETEAFAAADRLDRQVRIAAVAALLAGLTMLGIASHLLRRYRQRLDDRDAELRGVLTRSNDIIARYDADRRCVFTSPAIYDVLGWKPSERLGRTAVDLLYPEDVQRFIDEGPGTWSDDVRTLRLQHRDGHEVWLEVASTVERAADGSVIGYDTVGRDVTARHQAEIELAEARDAAVAASRSKSVFLANTSHELRTPLNGVLGLTELLLGTDLDEQQREYARTVQISGRNLLVILDDILDLAKIEAGRITLESVAFTLADVVESTTAPFRSLTAAKGIALEIETDPELPLWVRGDPTRFGQVLANLVSNAVKFTSTGAVRVRVHLEHTDGAATQANAQSVRVQVQDSGIGIGDTALEHLFEAFTQADSGTTRRYGGTGLGLAVSRQLAQLQGGSLTAASSLGEGSTFTFVVPLPSAQAPVRDPAGAEPVAPGRRLRVLVAEDNAVNQLVARMMLEGLGHQVDVVEDGQAAVDAVLHGSPPYDVVFMDCQMPVLDGYEATRQIRRGQDTGRRTPVVGLTASAMTQERDQGLAAGMDLYLSKPIRVTDLSAALRSVSDSPGMIPAPR